MIKVMKDTDGNWMVWNKSNGKTAKIVKFQDGIFGHFHNKYRIDINGVTRITLINHFQTANRKAMELVQ